MIRKYEKNIMGFKPTTLVHPVTALSVEPAESYSQTKHPYDGYALVML